MADPAVAIAALKMAKDGWWVINASRRVLRHPIWVTRNFAARWARYRLCAESLHAPVSHELRDLILGINTTLERWAADELDSDAAIDDIDSLGICYCDEVCEAIGTFARQMFPGDPTVIVWLIASIGEIAASDAFAHEQTRLGFDGNLRGFAKHCGCSEDAFEEDQLAANGSSEMMAWLVAKSSVRKVQRQRLSRFWAIDSCTPMRLIAHDDRLPLLVYCADIKDTLKNPLVAYGDPVPEADRKGLYKSVCCLPIRQRPFNDREDLAGFLWIDSRATRAFRGTLKTCTDRPGLGAFGHYLHAAADSLAASRLVIERARQVVEFFGPDNPQDVHKDGEEAQNTTDVATNQEHGA